MPVPHRPAIRQPLRGTDVHDQDDRLGRPHEVGKETMKAAVYNMTGESQVLPYRDVADPFRPPDDVRALGRGQLDCRW